MDVTGTGTRGHGHGHKRPRARAQEATGTLRAGSRWFARRPSLDVQSTAEPSILRHWFKYFTEIRHNEITGSVGSTSAPLGANDGGSGIHLLSLVRDTPAPKQAFGVSISRNLLSDTALLSTSESDDRGPS